jgi:hypothetical protein
VLRYMRISAFSSNCSIAIKLATTLVATCVLRASDEAAAWKRAPLVSPDLVTDVLANNNYPLPQQVLVEIVHLLETAGVKT